MTELFILGKIIWDWRASLTDYQKHCFRRPYRFLFAADIWVFINLILALIISVPAFNLFTHGTHVIVAHTMGATIGINTMILLGSIYFILEQRAADSARSTASTMADSGYWLANGSLLIFLMALLAAGLIKGTYTGDSFGDMMETISPYLLIFAFAGVGLMLGLWMVLLPALRQVSALVFSAMPRSGHGMKAEQISSAGD